MESGDAPTAGYAQTRGGGAALGVALLLSLLSATCCVLPIGLSILGLGGAWLTVFGPFTAYRSFILIGVGIVLVIAWARLIRRRHNPIGRPVLLITILATLAFAISVSAPYWEGEATRALWALWKDTL